MVIVNGRIYEDEQVVAALEALGPVALDAVKYASSLSKDNRKRAHIQVAQRVPEGLLCAGVDGDIPFPGIYVELVEEAKVSEDQPYTHGALLAVVERPTPELCKFMPPEDGKLQARIYGDFANEEYTHQEQFQNPELAFTEE